MNARNVLAESEIVKQGLRNFTQIKAQITFLHSLFLLNYPVAFTSGQSLFIYDVEIPKADYRFVKSVALEIPLPSQVRAAFPVESFGGNCCCIVSPDIFESKDGYALLLHECVHCYQYLSCENELKYQLELAKRSKSEGNYMWEINHPFPYDDNVFEQEYRNFTFAIQTQDDKEVEHTRFVVLESLSKMDREYLIWQEWKEGFARYLENKIRNILNLPINLAGMELPFSRTVFYAGGAQYIEYLEQRQPHIVEDLHRLFYVLNNNFSM